MRYLISAVLVLLVQCSYAQQNLQQTGLLKSASQFSAALQQSKKTQVDLKSYRNSHPEDKDGIQEREHELSFFTHNILVTVRDEFKNIFSAYSDKGEAIAILNQHGYSEVVQFLAFHKLTQNMYSQK